MMKKILSFFVSTCFLAAVASASLADLLPETLVDKNGNAVSRSQLEGKLVGIYFSAEWCPPCRQFTPVLASFRNENTSDFEVVFVSSDRSPADMKKYMTGYNMDFLAVEHGSDAAAKLREKFSPRGIPFLVIVDENGKTVTTQGRNDVARNARGAIASWRGASR